MSVAINTHHFRLQAFSIMTTINVLLLLLAFGLAPLHGSWLPAVIIGLPSVAVPFMLYRLLGDHAVSRISYGISFMFFSALHIHQSMGMTEVHFGIFVLLAILTAFRDWLVIVIAAVTIAIHHLLFMYLESQGAGVYLVPQSDATLTIVFIHAAYVLVETLALVIICRKSYREGVVGQVFFDVTEAMVTADNKVLLNVRCPDFPSKLITSFNNVLATLQSTVKTIEQATSELRQEATGLLEEGGLLSDGMGQKLKEVERIAAATEQMSQSIEQVYKLSQDVLQYSRQAEQSAFSGQHSVTSTVAAVTELEQTLGDSRMKVNAMAESVNEIGKVLDVIQTIAEQTNLLALNAAIEAARAGEQGRGFAVVADEVRTLASRTRGSTEEVNTMIARLTQVSTESVDAVNLCLTRLNDTVRFAKQSGEQLADIAEQSRRVSDSAEVMAETLQQQSSASTEIAQSAQQLSDMTKTQNKQGARVLKSAYHLEKVTDILATESGRFEA